MTYVVFGWKTKEYKTAQAASDAYKAAGECGFYYQVWRKYPDNTLVRWL